MPQLEFATYVPQLVWLAITFIVLYLVMSKVALPRIANVLEERQRKIQHDLDEAERLKSEAEKALAEYDTALAGARDQAHQVLAAARAELQADTEARRASVEADIAAQTAKAEAAVAAAKAEAMAGVQAAAVDTASAIVHRIAGLDADQASVDAAVADQLRA